MTEESNITVVKLERQNKKNNKNIKYQYINTWITNKITKQNYDPFYPPYDSGIHYRNIHLLSTCVPSFNSVGLTVPEKSVAKFFNVWNLERKKNEEIHNGMNADAELWHFKLKHADSGINNTSNLCPWVYQVHGWKFYITRILKSSFPNPEMVYLPIFYIGTVNLKILKWFICLYFI